MIGILLRGLTGGLFGLAFLVACTPKGTAETRVRTALDLLADVVDPAFGFATDACTWREAQAVARCEAGSDKGCDEYDRIKPRCVQVRASFREIRRLHTEAAGLVEAGKVEEAQREIERVRAIWSVLRADAPAVAGADGGAP